MKCSKCGHNHKRIFGNKCSNCGHEFTFDPKTEISDYFFKKLLYKASKEHSIYFTTRNLYAIYKNISEKKVKQNRLVSGILALVLPLGFLLPFTPFTPIYFISRSLTPFYYFILGIFELIAVIKFFSSFSSLKFDYKQFIAFIPRWLKNNPEGADYLIDQKSRLNPKFETSIPENDIYNYGLEGVVFVDEDQYVDWLIMNSFHFTNRVAVISVKGYPQNLQETIQNLITETPALPIYFLHNGNTNAKKMRSKISFVSLNASKYQIDVGITYSFLQGIEPLKKLANTPPFTPNFPLDILSYPQVSNLFTQFKANIDSKRQQLHDDDDHDEIDMVMIGDLDGVGNILDLSTLDMDLDFG